MSDVKKARELEQLRCSQFIDGANQEEQKQVASIKAQMAIRGISQSGKVGRAITDVRVQKIRNIVSERIRIRRDLILDFPELGSDDALNELSNQIDQTIQHAFGGGLLQVMPGATRSAAASILLNEEAQSLSEQARREIEILKREVALNLHNKRKPAPVTPISVNAPGGAALVNLGVIYGNVEQVIGTVGDAGHLELATLLEQLATAIKNAEVIEKDKATYLEQVKFIAEQAVEPAESRNTSVVVGLYKALQAGLQSTANVAQIIAVAGPALARYFGFQWPL